MPRCWGFYWAKYQAVLHPLIVHIRFQHLQTLSFCVTGDCLDQNTSLLYAFQRTLVHIYVLNCLTWRRLCTSVMAPYKDRKYLSACSMIKILISLLNGISSQQAMGMGMQMEWEGQWTSWLQRQIYRECTIIKFKHLMNFLITAATATCTALHSFMSKENKCLTIRRNLQNHLISQ